MDWEMVDISVHGVGLLSKTLLPKGTVVDLEFPGSALTVPKAAAPPIDETGADDLGLELRQMDESELAIG